MFPGPCHQPLFWYFHLRWQWVMLRVSPGQDTAWVMWFMVHYFRETAIFSFILKRALKTYRSWENIIWLLKTRFVNRCMRLFCHHTDGQKTFSCHGNKMYSTTNEKDVCKRKVFVLPVVISWQQLLNLSFIVLKLQLKILQTTFLINAVSVSCRLPAICLQISLLWEALAFSSLVIYLDVVSLLNEHRAVSNRWMSLFSWSSS